MSVNGQSVTLAEINKISGAHHNNFNEDIALYCRVQNVGQWFLFLKI